MKSTNDKEVNRNLLSGEHTYTACDPVRDSPIFRMKINGKECNVLFDTGSTVNILGRETLVDYLGVPEKFIQGQLTGIKGISGQRILNQGNVQLPTEMLGYKSVESFAVLPELKFSFHALIGFRTMKNWGIVLDCRKRELSLPTDNRHQCLELEDEMSPSNWARLIEMPTSSQNHVSEVEENMEQIHSVFEEVVQMDESQETSAIPGAYVNSKPHLAPEDIGVGHLAFEDTRTFVESQIPGAPCSFGASGKLCAR